MVDWQMRNAKRLRSEATDAERLLWTHLRAHCLAGAKFRRQQPIGRYIVDFVCFESRLIVEVDGSQHFESASDRERDAWLRGRGYTVLRFWNGEVLQRTEAVLERIASKLTPLSPYPSPARGEGNALGLRR
ncbi:MAG TPA: endonuclease domain-containing protein [Burkholderiaceae bacterium]|jgi:very-short-patch-repair endonuclease|nr:endonuclease domain-containing protein [Burkholderiaceae bacterium]